MKDYGKSILILFLTVLGMTFSLFAYAAIPEETEIEMTAENMAQAFSDQPATVSEPVVAPLTDIPVPVSSDQIPQEIAAMPTQTPPVVPAQTTGQPTVVPQTAAEPAAPLAETPASSETKVAETEKTPATLQPSGITEISGLKYPAYLYVPNDYKTDRTYPMVMIAPSESAEAKNQIEYLTGFAQRRSVFILSPYVLWPTAGETPYNLDTWFLSVKKDVVERFPINKKRIYLLGKGTGAHYAAYLATKYPQEFSAAVLLGKGWEGSFSKIINLYSDPVKQIPFYVAFKVGSEEQTRNQVWLDRLQKRGYFLNVAEYQKDEDLDELEFKKSFFDWLEDKSQSWAAFVAKSQKGWKWKLKNGVKDFFAV